MHKIIASYELLLQSFNWLNLSNTSTPIPMIKLLMYLMLEFASKHNRVSAYLHYLDKQSALKILMIKCLPIQSIEKLNFLLSHSHTSSPFDERTVVGAVSDSVNNYFLNVKRALDFLPNSLLNRLEKSV